MSVLPGPGLPQLCVIHVKGSLCVPVSHDLRRGVKRAVDRDARVIVLDLAEVLAVDAAGVGELVRAYNMIVEAEGVLQLVNVTSRVRALLERAGLFDLLAIDRYDEHRGALGNF